MPGAIHDGESGVGQESIAQWRRINVGLNKSPGCSAPCKVTPRCDEVDPWNLVDKFPATKWCETTRFSPTIARQRTQGQASPAAWGSRLIEQGWRIGRYVPIVW